MVWARRNLKLHSVAVVLAAPVAAAATAAAPAIAPAVAIAIVIAPAAWVVAISVPLTRWIRHHHRGADLLIYLLGCAAAAAVTCCLQELKKPWRQKNLEIAYPRHRPAYIARDCRRVGSLRLRYPRIRRKLASRQAALALLPALARRCPTVDWQARGYAVHQRIPLACSQYNRISRRPDPGKQYASRTQSLRRSPSFSRGDKALPYRRPYTHSLLPCTCFPYRYLVKVLPTSSTCR